MTALSNIPWDVVFLTLRVALISTLVTLPIAVALAWVLARKTGIYKSVLEGIINIPLVAPPVVTGYLLLVTLGKNSVLGSFIFDVFGIRLTFNFISLVIASVVVSLPLATRSIRSAFELIDPELEKASYSLGASKWDTFRRVNLPLAMPGILGGTVLSFARCLGEFGATITLAGNIPGVTQTISLMVYSNMQVPGQEGAVSMLVVISLGLSFSALVIAEIIYRKNKVRSRV